MDLFRITIGVEGARQKTRIAEIADTLVDTGSDATWIPRSIPESLGIAEEKTRTILLDAGPMLAVAAA